MEKRYQVFVSSTYADLQEERRNVIQTLMELDCIPAGMELFPAVDEEQWEFIKKVINDCDYYLLIIGGRYGSITSEGISYTEKEYDYAVSIGLKVIAFIHGNPEKITFEKSEENPELREKLESFRQKVSEGRLVRYWQNANELPGLVALSISKTIKTYPAIGWIRSNQISNEDLLYDINELRKQNTQLEKEIESYKRNVEMPSIDDLSDLDDGFHIKGVFGYANAFSQWETDISWLEIFLQIAPYLLQYQNDYTVQEELARSLFGTTDYKPGRLDTPTIDDQIYQTIKIQLIALGLVKLESLPTNNGGQALFWILTNDGKKLLFHERTIKK